MKDSSLKEALLKHYWIQRCFVQPEVEVQPPHGISSASKLMTDIDVLILRPHNDLYYEKILGDCRTLKEQSPIGRALWLKGLMDFTGSTAGVILLGSVKVELDHKIATNQIGIRLQNEDEFRMYDRAIVYPEGSEQAEITLGELRNFRNLGQRFPRLQPLLTYAYRDALLEPHFSGQIRHMIGYIRGTSREFDPSKPEQVALLCDMSAIFGIGLAQCSAEVFKQCVQPSTKESLSEILKIMVWGGREQYQFSESLRKKVLAMKSGVQEYGFDSLALPEWNSFLQLVRNLLERPSSAFALPWILRRLALDIGKGSEPLKSVCVTDLLAVKFAMLTISYLCKACRLPGEFEKELISKLVSVQSRLVANRERGGPSSLEKTESKASSEESLDNPGPLNSIRRLDLFGDGEESS